VGGGPALRIFLIADVRGYTTFTQERGDEAAAALAARFATIARDRLEAHGGTGLELRGDEVMAVFTSARQAIRAAVDLQGAFVDATIADPSLPLPVGMGLDAGEAVEVEDGYRGGALNLAARLCSIAGPGEILASQEVVHLARRVDGVSQTDRGTVRLKGLAEPVRLSRLTKEGWDPEQDAEYQRALGLRAGRPRPAGFEVCPYRGLAAFQPEDADRFFGRERLVAELVERLDHDRVLFVVGPSGSGKSSLVRAGLIRAVETGAIHGSDRWPVALFTPRSNPTKELSYQLGRIAETVSVSTERPMPRALPGPSEARRLADAIVDVTGGLMMVIDQFEELFTLNDHRAQSVFVETLTAVADPAGSRVRIVIAMRADFYGACATFPWLARRVTANQALVGPMTGAELRRAIEQPATAVGLRLEDGLADAVLDDAGSEPSALPLVSHAMAETWRRREGDTLTLGGYREAGGVAGSISQTADTLYGSVFDADEQDACRRLMLRLVTPGEGTSDTRARLPMSDLDHDREPRLSRNVAGELVDARLLTVDRDSIEIAHEALLQSWPRLRQWIAEGRDDLRTRQRIGHAAAEWRAQAEDPDLLYRGTPLQAALEWAGEHGDLVGPQERDFLVASRTAFLEEKARSEEAAKRSRRLRRVAVSALAVLAVAAIGASVIAFAALGQARARYAESLATQARALAGSDPRRATALAQEALARGDSSSIDARAALVDASRALAAASFVPSGPPVPVGDALSIVVDPDGAFIVTGNRDGSISTWSATGASLSNDVPGHSKAIEEMDLTPDGRLLVTGSDDASVLVWDLADPDDVPAPRSLGETTGIVWGVAVSPDGTTAATASEDGTIRLWDIASGAQLGGVFADLEGDSLTVAFNPDGALLMVGNGVGEVVGFDVDGGGVVVPAFDAHASDVWEIEFDADGSRFATASSDGRIRIWDTSTQELLAEPFARSADDVRGVSFDGDRVLAGDEDGRLLVAYLEGPSEPTASAPHEAQVVDAAIGGGTLATLGFDQQMQIWSRGQPTAVVVPEPISEPMALAASPDGDRLAIGDGDGAVRVVSASTGDEVLPPITLHDGAVRDLAYSEDGTRLASGGDDGVAVIDATSGAQLAPTPDASAAVDAVLWAEDLLLTGGADGIVRIWNGTRLEDELGPHGAAVTDMAVSADGVLAVADQVGGIGLWDLDERRAYADPIAAEDNTIWDLAWSPDGAVLAAASDNERVELWDIDARRLVHSLTPQPGGAASVVYLGDGATIVTTSRDGVVRVWDAATAEPLGGPLEGHSAAVWRVVSLPDMRFATSSEDGTVRIWDVLNPTRACDRAEGTLGLDALGDFMGEGEEPVACGDP
jgi:WD40 repeat protein/class 3 adenylate cyclase